MTNRPAPEKVARYADMFSAMGTEARLRIMQLLLSAHPDGLVVSEIQESLEIPGSTLSHHLDKLKSEDLVHVTRESTFLRYTANTDALSEVLRFLCTGNSARSIMGDAILNHRGRPRFSAYSAGGRPSGAVRPEALKQLETV